MSTLGFIGNYQLLDELASGGYGQVFRGKHMVLTNRIVAIKLLNHARIQSPQEREQFLKEAQVLELLKHPYILPVVDVGIHGGTPYIVTEFATGGSLRQYMRKHTTLLSTREILPILSQVAQALDYAHQHNIIHRDLKPENILFNAQGNALLADFGLSTIVYTRGMQYALGGGTPPYMSPEQFRDAITRESDQYSLGCMTYELLTGRLPFYSPDYAQLRYKHLTEQALPPHTINPRLSIQVSQVIFKALAKDSQARYRSELDFLAALASASADLPSAPLNYTSATYQTPPTVKPAGTRPDLPTVNAQSNPGITPPETQAANAQPGKGSTQPDFSNVFSSPVPSRPESLPSEPPAQIGTPFSPDEDLVQAEPASSSADIAQPGKGGTQPDLPTITASPSGELGEFTTLYKQGISLYEQKRSAEALATFDQAISLNPDAAGPYFYKGQVHRDLKQYETALSNYDQAIRLGEWAIYHNGRGIVLDLLGCFADALTAYDRAIQLEPDNATYFLNKAVVLQKLQRYSEALLVLDQGIKVNPHYITLYIQKCSLLRLHLQQPADALGVCEQGLVVAPQNADLLNNKGLALNSLTRFSEAIATYDQALQYHASIPYLYANKGVALRKLHRYEEALLQLNQALDLDHRYGSAYYQRGLVFSALNRHTEALQDFTQAILFDPKALPNYHKKGEQLIILRRYDEALAVYEQALHLKPQDPYLLQQKGHVLGLLQRYPEALIAYDKALNAHPRDPKTHFARGQMLKYLGHHAEADHAFLLARQLGYKE